MAIERRGKGQSLVTRYHYDCQHQLVRAELPDGTTANYDYDAFGRRIRKRVGRVNGEHVTEFLWQANNLIAESGSDGGYRSFIYEPGSFKPLVQLEGEGQDTEVFHYQLDHLGTPLALTRDNGATAWQVRYRAYGNVWREEIAEVATPLRFQGQYFDAETGLHYNRHRYYQPETGRFITPDPIGLAGGLNNYQYAPNPTGWVDPLGLTNILGQCPDASEGAQSQQQGGPDITQKAAKWQGKDPYPGIDNWSVTTLKKMMLFMAAYLGSQNFIYLEPMSMLRMVQKFNSGRVLK